MSHRMLLTGGFAVIIVAVLLVATRYPGVGDESDLSARDLDRPAESETAAPAEASEAGETTVRRVKAPSASAALGTVPVRGVLRARGIDATTRLRSRAFRVDVVGRGTRRRHASKTDSEGRFVVDALRPGTYELIFSSDGFVPLATGVTVESGRNVPNLEVLLAPGIRVLGQIRDLDERTRGDAVVTWRAPGEADGEREAIVDDSGAWELSLETPGRYDVRVVPRRLRALWHDAPWRQVTVRENGAQRFDLTADLGQTLPIVVARDGRTAAGVDVRCIVKTPSRSASVVLPPTDAQGRTSIAGLPVLGSLVIDVVSGEVGATSERIELDLGDLPAEARLALTALRGPNNDGASKELRADRGGSRPGALAPR